MEDSIFMKRHSGRSYLEKAIPSDVIMKLSEIVRWTPSCANKQPWRFVFCRSGEERQKFNEALA
ncbi:MAG: nitroreductase family protein, partial [bacterium]|nr:nitroreductase family protein [bacterium]